MFTSGFSCLFILKFFNNTLLQNFYTDNYYNLDSKVKVKEPCIELIQENSIEFLIQMCLSYISLDHGLCTSTSNLF